MPGCAIQLHLALRIASLNLVETPASPAARDPRARAARPSASHARAAAASRSACPSAARRCELARCSPSPARRACSPKSSSQRQRKSIDRAQRRAQIMRHRIAERLQLLVRSRKLARPLLHADFQLLVGLGQLPVQNGDSLELAAICSRSRPARTSSSKAATSRRKSSTNASVKLPHTQRRAEVASAVRSASRRCSSASMS